MAQSGKPEGFGMFVLRLWMWAVPVIMLGLSLLFAAIAATNGSWGLLVLMIFMALMAVGLFTLHWWLMYRIGRRAEQ